MTYQINEANLQRQRVLAESTNRLARKYLKQLELASSANILDLGCGLGYTTRELSDCFPSSHCHGLDLDQRLVEHARQLSEESHPTIEYQVADAHALPFPDGHFDLVYGRFLMLHVPGPAEVLMEMKRVVKPGGLVMIQDFDLLTHSGLYPASWAYDKMVEGMNQLYSNPQIGRQLPAMFGAAGLQPKVRSDIFLVSNFGVSKQLMTLTAEGMLEAMQRAGILKEGEEQTLMEEMRRVEASEAYQLLTNPIITVWAVK